MHVPTSARRTPVWYFFMLPGKNFFYYTVVANWGFLRVCINILVGPSYGGRLDVFIEVFCQVQNSRCKKYYELVLLYSIYQPPKSHVHTFGFLWFYSSIRYSIRPAVVCSNWCYIWGGCMCPSLISVFLISTDSCVFMYNPQHSASSSDAITDFITLAKINIGPLKNLPYLLPK